MPVVTAIAALGLALLALVGIAIWRGQGKPPAPPVSEVDYTAEPPQRARNRDRVEAVPTAEPRPAASEEIARVETASPPEDAATETAPYAVFGMVVDAGSGEGIAGVDVIAERVEDPEEYEAWREAFGEAEADEDAERMAALSSAYEAMSARYNAQSDAAGSFTFPLLRWGQYRVAIESSTYLPATRTVTVSEDDTRIGPVRLQVARGGIVSGRVTIAGTGQGADGVLVVVERSDVSAESDAMGAYTLSPVPLGEQGITLNLFRTEFKPARELPYAKVTLSPERLEARNVNFEVEAAGIVWGYVTTPDRQPVQNATVVLTESKSIFSQALTAVVSRERPVTDSSEEDGYYELLGVPLNREWRIWASSDAMAPQLADPFLLTAQQRSVRIDVFLFDGTTIFGQVVTSTGAPVGEASVACIPEISALVTPLENPQAFREATSDELGFFEIAELPRGGYQLYPRKEGYQFDIQGTLVYPDGYNDINGVRLTLEPIEPGDFAVFGVVADGSGNPISGATLEISGFGSDNFRQVDASTSSGGDGRFLFEGIERGSYSLEATHPEYAATRLGRVLIDTEIQVVMTQSAIIRGRVLVDGGGDMPPEYSVTALPVNLDAGGDIALTSLNASAVQEVFGGQPDGRYELRVPPGDYRLEGRADGFTPARIQVSAAPAEVVEDIDLPLSDDGGVISGRVVTATGDSPQGAEVSVSEFGGLGAANAGSIEGFAPQRVGEDGAFEFTQLPSGEYTVVAEHPVFANGSEGPIVLQAGQQATNVVVRLGEGGVLFGYVFANNGPVEGALVLAANSNSGATGTAETDPDGYYEMDGLSTGSYTVTVTGTQLAAFYERDAKSASVQEGQRTRLDFGQCDAGANVAGFCNPPPFDPTGGQIILREPGAIPLAGPGERIGLDGIARLNLIASTAVGPAGRFELECVLPGVYLMEVYYFSNIVQGGDAINVYTDFVEIPAQNLVNLPPIGVSY